MRTIRLWPYLMESWTEYTEWVSATVLQISVISMLRSIKRLCVTRLTKDTKRLVKRLNSKFGVAQSWDNESRFLFNSDSRRSWALSLFRRYINNSLGREWSRLTSTTTSTTSSLDPTNSSRTFSYKCYMNPFYPRDYSPEIQLISHSAQSSTHFPEISN